MCERHCRARAVRVGVCVLVALAGTAGAATVTTGPATSTLTSAGPAQAVRGARLTARLLAHAARSLGHLRDGRVVGRGGRILCLLRFARRVDPLCPAANAQLVELQESLGSPAEAARAAADYLRVRPDDYTMALRWLGLSQATTDSAGQRVALLQAALKQRRFPAEVRAAAAAELAAVYVRQGEVELARRACAQALRLDPYQRAALQTQGRLDQKADAAATLRRMLLQLQGAPRDLSLCTAIARDLQGAGLYEQALVFYEHAQALAKVKPPAFAQYEQLLVDHCNALLDAGRPEQAARTFAPMVEQHPLNLALRSLLIEAYRALKDERRAAAQVTAMGGIYRAASASPKRSPAQTVELAWYELRYRGRPESALKLARKAVAGDASDTFARMVLAAAELAAGHAGPARAVLTELAPRRPYAAVVLARYYYAHGQPQAARTVLLKGAGDVRTGPAWRELRSLAKEKGVALPPLPRAAAMARVARQLPPEVLEMGRRPERFLRVSLSAPRAVVQVGEPVVVTVTLENVSQRRLPLGPDGLLAPVVVLGLSIGGDLQADLPEPVPPPLHPGTRQPITPADLEPIFAKALIAQDVSQERWIDIPDDVVRVLSIWRPAPLVRATGLEAALKTPARIYFKDESHSPPGSHKPNTAVAQAYYAKQEGLEGFATETGAGQWGSALSLAGLLFGLKIKVFMVAVSYRQKPYRRIMMETWGGEVVPSPSTETHAGQAILAQDPESPGSLGIAISEAIEYAMTHDGYKYSLGSVVNFVLLHQTVIGLESLKQMEMAGDYPDILIGCAGGGSNAAGLIFPFLRDKLTGQRPDMRAIFVESTACPSMTRGKYAYDWGDTAKTGPVTKMHTVGHSFIPAPVHAGGLRYHGMAPLVSALLKQGYVEARAYHQNEVFEAAHSFSAAEGIIVAPETAHAVRAALDEALACRESGESKVILFNASGHGHFDLSAYDAYHRQQLEDYRLEEEKLRAALAELPQVEG